MSAASAWKKHVPAAVPVLRALFLPLPAVPALMLGFPMRVDDPWHLPLISIPYALLMGYVDYALVRSLANRWSRGWVILAGVTVFGAQVFLSFVVFVMVGLGDLGRGGPGMDL